MSDDLKALASLDTFTADQPMSSATHEVHAQLENQLQDLLNRDSGKTTKHNGDILTYGHAILAAVVYENYEQATGELDTLLGLRKDYPLFGEKASPYVEHAKTLVKAIKTKRAVAKAPHLTKTKQKEIIGALTFHFKELRSCILNIEKIERHARKEDISSTRTFILTLYFCCFFIFSYAFFQANFPDLLVAIYRLFLEGFDAIFIYLSHWLWPVS